MSGPRELSTHQEWNDMFFGPPEMYTAEWWLLRKLPPTDKSVPEWWLQERLRGIGFPRSKATKASASGEAGKPTQ